MGSLRQSGKTVLNLTAIQPATPVADPLLAAVRLLARGEFEVLGEMGRGTNQGIVYLARDLSDRSLAALRLEAGGAPDEYLLEVVEQLDASVPAVESQCPGAGCGQPLRGWGRYCPHCGIDLGGASGGMDPETKRALLEEVARISAGAFEILGEMPRAEGGGLVYFARDLETGALTALRLQRVAGQEYELGVTRVMSSIAEDLDARAAAPVVRMAAVPPSTAPDPTTPESPTAPHQKRWLSRPAWGSAHRVVRGSGLERVWGEIQSLGRYLARLARRLPELVPAARETLERIPEPYRLPAALAAVMFVILVMLVVFF